MKECNQSPQWQQESASTKWKYRPSSSAWQWGNLTLTQYNSGCPRYIVLEQLTGLKVEIDPIYQRLGAHHEAILEQEFGDEVAARELVIKRPITESVTYSGRADFVMKTGEIVEAKASLVKYKASFPLLPKQSHLSQVVSYMLELEHPTSRLVWGYYKATREGPFETLGRREYRVELNDKGQVVVDGMPTQYFAQDQLQHQQAVAKALESGDWESVERPYNWAAKFGSPCERCPFKTTHCEVKDAFT